MRALDATIAVSRPSALLRFLLPLLVISLLLAACGAADAPVIGSCTLPLDDDASDTDKIAALLRAEGELVVAQEIDALMALWASGGEVVDAKHTPADPIDDQKWVAAPRRRTP